MSNPPAPASAQALKPADKLTSPQSRLLATMRSPWNPTPFMSSLAIAITIWLVLGAMEHQDWPKSSGNIDLIALPLTVFELIALGFVVDSARYGWPKRIAAVLMAGVLGFGLAIFAIMILLEWNNFCQIIFWSLAGMYLGNVTEATTGDLQGFCGTLAASADADRAKWAEEAERI